jgi:hypothetical protein
MIKKLYNYILSIKYVFLLVAIVPFICGCTRYDEKNEVDWNGFNYAKCSKGSNDPKCKSQDDSGI